MSYLSSGVLTWDLDELVTSMKLTPDEVREYFTDGRRVSFLLERRLAREVIKGKLAASEGASYDLTDGDGKKWEVRSITRSGIYFCPSYMVGSGRSFNAEGFLEKLNEIEGYIVSDVEDFPSIRYWKISKDLVRGWFESGKLGAGTKISRKAALNLIGAE